MELSLDRFKSAQEGVYETALWEIQAGRKEGHWIWYIFPQIQGLGHSNLAVYYAIRDEAEALAYWKDSVLSERLTEITRALLALDDSVDRILGYPDDLKVRSCMTLFWLVTGEQLFKDVLDKFYGGEPDPWTIKKLSTPQPNAT